MSLLNLVRQGVAKARPKQKTFQFGPWPGGLVTTTQAEQLKSYEAFELLNIVLVSEGIARTRDGLEEVCSGCTGDPISVGRVLVNGTWKTLITDDDNKLYYDNSGTATLIKTLSGETRFLGFMDVAILFDNSYLKQYDGTSVTMLYDDGTGVTTAYQYYNRAGSDDTNITLGDGTNSRVAAKFTSQAWDSGYTIPPTTVFAKLKKAGTGGSGAILAKIRKVSDDSVLASMTLVSDVTAISDDEEYDATFAASEITTELSPSTAYYLSLEFTNADGDPPTNHVLIKCTTVASGGVGYHYAAAAWAADSTKDPIMGLKPGRPPKGYTGVVFGGRVFFLDPDNEGYLRYCSAGNQYDYSTTNGGGYVGAVDSDSNSFPIGGIASFYGSLYLFGTSEQPFLGTLTGDTPSEYAVTQTLQRVSGDYKSIVVAPDSIYFLSKSGIGDISTIEAYGDINAVTQTDNIRRTIHQYYSSAAFAGYVPEWGIYLLKLAGYDSLIALHSKIKTVVPRGMGETTISPCTKWEFAIDATPTCFGEGDNYMFVGFDDGKIYKTSSSVVADDDIAVTYKIWPNFQSTVFGEYAAEKVSVNAFGRFGGDFDLAFYKNNSRTSFHTISFTVPWDTTVSLDELIGIDVAEEDMGWLVEPGNYFDRRLVNYNFRSTMIGIENITLNGKPMWFGPVVLLADSIGGL